MMRPLSLRNKRGQSAVEFVFAFAMFIGLMLIIADLTKICYNWVSITLAVEQASRTGKTVPTAVRMPTIHTEVKNIAGVLGIKLADEDVTVKTVDSSIEVGVTHNVKVNALTGLLLLTVGDHGGIYTIYVSEAIHNDTFAQLFWI